jgi:hypothetical protein
MSEPRAVTIGLLCSCLRQKVELWRTIADSIGRDGAEVAAVSNLRLCAAEVEVLLEAFESDDRASGMVPEADHTEQGIARHLEYLDAALVILESGWKDALFWRGRHH